MKKLLFDLRGNPGGVLEQAVDVTDVFVPKGAMVVYTRGRTASSAQEYYAPGDGAHFDQPLVVLVNRGLGLGLRDRGRSHPGPRPRPDRRPAHVGQGPRPERLHAVLRRGPRPDHGALLHALRPLDPEGLQRPARLREPGRSRLGFRRADRRRGAASRPPRAPSSTPTPAAWSTPRAASRPTSSSRTTGTRSSSSSCWSRYAFFNFAVDWLARHPNVAEDFEVTPGDPRRVLPVRREVRQVLDRRGAQEGLRRRTPTAALVDLAIQIEIVNAKLRPRGRPQGLRRRRPPDPEGPDPLRRGLPDRFACRRRSARWPSRRVSDPAALLRGAADVEREAAGAPSPGNPETALGTSRYRSSTNPFGVSSPAIRAGSRSIRDGQRRAPERREQGATTSAGLRMLGAEGEERDAPGRRVRRVRPSFPQATKKGTSPCVEDHVGIREPPGQQGCRRAAGGCPPPPDPADAGDSGALGDAVDVPGPDRPGRQPRTGQSLEAQPERPAGDSAAPGSGPRTSR